MCLSICCSNYVHCAQNCPGTTRHLSSWEHGQQISEAQGENRHTAYRVCTNDEMNHEAGDGDLLATEDAEVLTPLASPAPGKGREDPVSSIQLLTQWNRVSSVRERQWKNNISKLEGTALIEARKFFDWRNKHKLRVKCNLSGSQIWWHEGCSDSHELEKERKMMSWCHHDQDAQSGVMRTWGVQTSFFAIEYLLSRVVDVATLCFICSRTLADRKMSKFLINTQKL